MDMKPKNVLLTADYSIAKIADVGLAHMMGASSSSSPARGTFAYAAPEQLLSQHCDEKVRHPLSLATYQQTAKDWHDVTGCVASQAPLGSATPVLGPGGGGRAGEQGISTAL